ncbi:MAG: sodium:alanine symporter family protein [Deltaproteobacteria bacterium]|nr:sodium:alanine symporter family protein [Deltaproteobacteria bacterium]
MNEMVGTLAGWVWGAPMLILLVGTGVLLTVRLRGIQVRGLFHALYLAFIVRREPDGEGDISHFQALMTALAATVGTGNIAGVATAIASGGPGALFWMWVTGFLGMATKYGEAVLAVKYRVTDARGEMAGGPMYYLRDGLGSPALGLLFAIFAAIASFGIGNMVQSNSVADAVNTTFQVEPWITGLVLAVGTGAVLLFGIKGIGKVAGVMVPAMILLYGAGTLTLLALHLDRIPGALALIFEHAFTPTAAAGGFAGAAVKEAVRYGVARGVFSNESGLGSGPIAAAAAQTRSPVSQALVSMTQTFIDTLVVCSLTGLAILVTDAWTSGENGASLTLAAFSQGLPWTPWAGGPALGSLVVTIGLITFAWSTILGWSYYGEKALGYLFGAKAILPYRVLFVALVYVGAVGKLELIWNLSDLMNGMMAFPNLVGLVMLSGVIAAETRAWYASRSA